MKLKEYINQLNNLAKEQPELLDLEMYDYGDCGDYLVDSDLITICKGVTYQKPLVDYDIGDFGIETEYQPYYKELLKDKNNIPCVLIEFI